MATEKNWYQEVCPACGEQQNVEFYDGQMTDRETVGSDGIKRRVYIYGRKISHHKESSGESCSGSSKHLGTCAV